MAPAFSGIVDAPTGAPTSTGFRGMVYGKGAASGGCACAWVLTCADLGVCTMGTYVQAHIPRHMSGHDVAMYTCISMGPKLHI